MYSVIQIEVLQMARLADEARAVLTPAQLAEIAASMDLTVDEVEARFAHASIVFEAAKPPADELPGTFANEPEQDRIHELMSQVAREAIASVNETAAAPFWNSRLRLHVFTNGQWQTLEREPHAPTIAHAPIQPYADAEELADALRASL